jgi:dolichol-phosphate mannosyltransferase
MTSLSPDAPIVSLLILALNEGENLRTVIPEAQRYLVDSGFSFEVVVIDGWSNDDTREVAQSFGARVFEQEERGYAEAFRQGLSVVRGQYIITLDGDCSHPASLIPVLLSKRHDADIVIGSRWIQGGSFEGPVWRGALSRLLNLIFQRLLALPISDISSGYRLYRRHALQPHTYRCQDFSVLEEVIVQALVEGFSITEVPLQYKPRQSGSSHVQLASFALSYLSTLRKMWLIRHDANGADYDHRAFDSRNVVQRWWQRRRFKNITELLGEHAHRGAVLDVGCGSSRIIQSLPHAVAYDYSLRKLSFLSKTNKLRVRGSALSLPFASMTFDCIIHSQLIEHLPMDDSIFSELRRVIKPGGTLLLGTVDYGTPIWPTIERIYEFLMPHAYAEEHISHYTLESLQKKIADFGFETLEVKTILRGEITLKARAR